MYEQIEKLIAYEHVLVTKDSLHYFDDLRDHLKRLDQKLYQSRDMMRQLLDLHMNNQSTKMNKIMSTLTLFSAIFIPLSFLTGFFGMNFHYFEALDYRYAVLVFIVVCVVIAGGMFLFFKKRRWF
jgi:magnesium transporter